uniref:Bromodomain containing 10 n=1 Tax=Sphenodon punctatus TaxID=8508 RepID=A0A8D0L9G4_SPHPU
QPFPGRPGGGNEPPPPPAAPDMEEPPPVAGAGEPRSNAAAAPPEDEEQPKEEDAGGGSTSSLSRREQNLGPELQQGYRILREFLVEKHRPLTAPFLKPLGSQEADVGEGGASLQGLGGSSQPLQPEQPAGMWLLKMEEKFSSGQYRGITDFVADFRLMLETCYRLHGVDHWLSKQAQKLEMMLEQKLAMLSRNLREKTTIAVTSKGCFGLEDEKGAACTSTRRRSTPRSLAGLTTGVFESIMIQVLRQEEQLRAKEEKRLREHERKEAEEASQKEIEEWEKILLAQASPTRMETLWEIPAIGHFLCLAQQILNLPEIVFYELERCLLMPQCNVFLSKIMTSLLSPPHRRATLHRRPTLPYRTWEAALRQKVQQWYTVVGQTDNPDSCAEKLGLCPQFFKVLGEVNPLEEKPFHELPFYQKVWLLKGLCDFVYETQKDVQDAVLGQPIHECREVILGYDYLENAYVHFPQFCGADVRIYKQKPFQAPEFPAPSIKVKRVSRIKLDRVKCEYVSKNNGEIRFGGREEQLPHAKTEPGESMDSFHCCPAKIHLDSFSVITEKEVKSSCENKIHRVCDLKKTGCCKENRDKLISPGEIVGFGQPLSPGEIRIVKNGQKCGEPSIVKKTEPTPLKENTLKTCQMHVNGNHSDDPDMNCRTVAREVILENSVRNNKKLKLTKVRAKKKKKKKKKLKNILSENLQKKRDDLQRKNKLYIIKKKAKHKKHKSGKLFLVYLNRRGGKVIVHFAVCPSVKELHCTLIRLLNELLPWEPKLMKAFQRNRSRLKKDYDDFQKQPDHDKFTRELWTNEGGEGDTGKESFIALTSKSLDSSEHEDSLRKDYLNSDDMKVLEMDFPSGKIKSLKKELTSKEIQKTLPKSTKRQYKQNSYLDDSTRELSPRKKAKLSTNEATVQSIENEIEADHCLSKLKQTEPPSPESLVLTDSTTSISKGTKSIQALLAKNIGNKVTLTSQLPPPVGRSISASEKLVVSHTESSPIKPALPCQATLKSPLQMVYKMPSGHCIPVDLHNSSMKIQMQPVIDPKTGERVMQQVLILPKNFLIQHKEQKNMTKESQSLQQKTSEQQCTSLPQAAAINPSLTPVTVTSTVNTTATQVSCAIFNKSVTYLSQGTSPVNRLQPLPSLASTSNLLGSAVKMSQSETGKSKTTISTATFPGALPAVSAAVQSLASATTLSGSTSTSCSLPSLVPQQSSDLCEAKQELKTVCIRDSQSILVRTRGGNTGIVKVQTNPDQISPNNVSPSSVFTYAPQLQAFFVPKSTTLSTSTFSSVATATSTLPQFSQPSVSGFSPPTATSVSIPTLPAGVNQVMGKNLKLALGQPYSGSSLGKVMEKTVHVSSPTFLSPVSSSSSLFPATPNSSPNVVSIPPGSTCQSYTSIAQTPLTPQQVDFKTKKQPATQLEAITTTSGDVASGTSIQKLMLVTNPPLLSSCGTTGLSVMPAPTSTGVSAQKLVFINTPIAGGLSNTSAVAESFKQTFPSSIGKTFVKNAEQPHLVLIPSTIGAPIKMSSSQTVSQVRDVKIGLNIGQAIVNTTSNAQSGPPINILQSAAPQGTEDKNSKGFILPLSTSGGLVPLCSSFEGQSITSVSESMGATRAANACTVTAANASLDPVSVTPSGISFGTRPTVLADGNNTSGIMPVLSNRGTQSNIGNTIAISTVKTGHLASSVLISTTQPTVCPQSLSSSLQFPVTVALPGPVMNAAPKVVPTIPPLASVPAAAQCMPLPKGQPPALVQFQTPGISSAVPSTNIHKSQTVLPPVSPNAGKVISFSNLVPLPYQPMPPNLIKPAPAYNCAPGVAVTQTAPASPAVTSQSAAQLSESCIQQKIIINTCTPLAPGTQIMINGARFIVPPQGLGAGSHVLLISANPKHGPPVVLNNGHGAQGVPLSNPIPQKATLTPHHSLNWQPPKCPLKSSTKIVNSLGTANTVPIVHATPQIVNTTAKSCTPPSATTHSMSSVIKPSPAIVAKASLVPAVHTDNSLLPSSTSVFQLDKSIKKLLVSPEGAILNAINTPASMVSSLSSSLSPSVMSTTRNTATVFPNLKSSHLDKPNPAVS